MLQGKVARIFGREPAFWVNLLGWLLVLASTFWLHLSTDAEGAVNAVISLAVGVAVALTTRDGISAAILGLIKGILIMLLAFHFNINSAQQAVIYGVAAAIIAGFTRTQVDAPQPPLPAPPLAQPDAAVGGGNGRVGEETPQ